MADERTDAGTITPQQDDPDTRESAALSAQDILLAPPPPPGGSGQIQVALAMQLIQGGGLHRLPEPIQKALVELADQSDNRGYSYAKASLEKQVELEHAELVDRGKGRKQLLVAIGSIAGGGLTF